APIALTTNNAQVWNSDITFTGTNSLNMGNGAVAINASRNVTVNGSTLTVGGLNGPSGNNYSLTKLGPGTLAISGSSNYGGSTNVNNGELDFTAGTSGTTASAINVAMAAGYNATLGIS